MKKTAPILLIILVILAAFGYVFHREHEPEPRSATIFLMDTLVEIKVVADEEAADQAFARAIKELRRVDAVVGYAETPLTRLNREHSLTDEEIYRLVRLGREIHEASGGGFSLTLRPILDAWGFSGTHPYRYPTDDEFAAWKAQGADEDIDLADDGETVTTSAGLTLDLAGIAKGYAADRAVQSLTADGISSGLINAGGDIRAFGDRTWRVGLKHPRQPGIISAIPITGRAIATSGDYERFVEHEGRRYCHILDPATGISPDHTMSATILAPTCAEADAWATAVFVRGITALEPVLKAHDLDWIVITADGNIHASEAMRAHCPATIP